MGELQSKVGDLHCELLIPGVFSSFLREKQSKSLMTTETLQEGGKAQEKTCENHLVLTKVLQPFINCKQIIIAELFYSRGKKKHPTNFTHESNNGVSAEHGQVPSVLSQDVWQLTFIILQNQNRKLSELKLCRSETPGTGTSICLLLQP